jgi:Cu(I)-responsive transcriptional regulator
MIRHYEESGVIRAPRRTQSNYRSYSDNDVHVLRFIKRARALGFSMADIKTLLSLWQDQSRPSSAVKRIARTHIDELQRKIAELQSMARTLEHLAHHCHGDHRPECPIIEELSK